MGFLTPFALAFAALGIPILILYMLKLRRRDVLVSSTLLWQRLLRDREANAPWQRLRRNLLLFLQLAILALLTLALARPFVPTSVVASGSVVILLDASASMQATDVADGTSADRMSTLTRFDAAVQVAREIVDGLTPSSTATIVAVGPQPLVLASTTSDRALLRRALDEVTPSDGTADWEAAFALAGASLAGAKDGKTVIISDGALPEVLPSLGGEVRFVGVGGGSDNLAIAALATREGDAGPQAFLRLVNYSDTDAEPLVEFSADGTLFDARRLSVPARASADLTLTDLPYDMRVLSAHLVAEDALFLGDALSVDNVAWAVHTPPVSGRVLLISEGNLFLERALGALPSVELARLSPDQPLPAEPYDLYVYDRVVTGTLPSGNLWLIGPLSSASDGFSIDIGGVFTATAITDVAEDPLLRYVDLSNVHVLQARRVESPPGARVLVAARGGPLLFVTERPEGRLAVLTFDLHDSDLPLQIAFPILTSNLADWLLPQGAARFPATVHPGEPVLIPPNPEATEIAVTAPDGEKHSIPIGEQAPVFVATDSVGAYLVEQVNQAGDVLQSAAFAVNLFDAAESDIAPRETVMVGQAEVAAEPKQEEGRREFWPWLAGVALCVVTVEWWAYQVGTGRWGDKGRGRH
jgi:Ca-activated chloride channel family protein